MKLSATARSALQDAIFYHPKVTKFVRSGHAILDMTDDELLKVAAQLGIDSTAPKSDAPPDDMRQYGFEGSFEFDLEFHLFGKVVKRRARIDFQNTPDWAYYDLKVKAEVLRTHSDGFGLKVLAIPEGGRWQVAGKRMVKCSITPVWTQLDILHEGVLSWDVKVEIYARINAICIEENKARLTAAKKTKKPRKKR